MVKREPKFMEDLHKIREQMTREWKGKSSREIVLTIHKATSKFRGKN